MKTKAEIKERLADLKAEKTRILKSGYVLSEVDYVDLECLSNEIATLNWVLN